MNGHLLWSGFCICSRVLWTYSLTRLRCARARGKKVPKDFGEQIALDVLHYSARAIGAVVAQVPYKHKVTGSNPVSPTRKVQLRGYVYL